MMLPGVELARRRRFQHRSDVLLRGPQEPSIAAHLQPIDEPIAAEARRRLEEKLCRPYSIIRSRSPCPSPSSHFPRWMRIYTTSVPDSSRQVHGSHDASSRKSRTGEKVRELTSRVSKTDVCPVCLDVFRVQQQVIWLPCAHRYHSTCVLPWLADHSHCPYCRTAVPPLELLTETYI